MMCCSARPASSSAPSVLPKDRIGRNITLAELHGDLFSRHASPLEGYVFVVVDDRGEDVLSNEICRRCNRKQQRRRRGGRTVQPPDWFVYDSDIYARMCTYVLCTRPNTLGEKQKRKTPLRSGLGKDVEHVCKSSGSICSKRCGHLDFCAENTSPSSAAVHGGHYDTEYLVEEGISAVYLEPARIS